MAIGGAIDPAIQTLAERAGILTQWQDANGILQEVQEPVLRNMLTAMDLPCMTPSQISDSLHHVSGDASLAAGDMVVVEAGQAVVLQHPPGGDWHVTLESGKSHAGRLQANAEGKACIPPFAALGYHKLQVNDLALTLAVVPPQCPPIKARDPSIRPWGLIAQIYSLREDPSSPPRPKTGRLPQWTQGSHFGAVARLAAYAAQQGANALALSPAHAMFSADPQRYGPYSPSSRLFLNIGYGDPAGVLGHEVVQRVLSAWPSPDIALAAHSGRLLDWPRVFPLRLRLLRSLYEHFRQHAPAHLATQYERFRLERGTALEQHACYEALHAHYASSLGPAHGWQDWPAGLRDPGSAATARFAAEHAAEIDFHVFAQWIAHESLLQAQSNAIAAGMSIGLIGDLAIGTDPRGSHAWSRQADIFTGVTVGAPPDVYEPQGQDWGLTAFSPRGLRKGAYAGFIDTLRATLRYTGGIRIDHVAGLERLWLVPEHSTAADGAYLRFPRHELLGLLTLEARRHDAVVIGENLGTVSEAFNTALYRRGILGNSVLWFEREPVKDAEGSAPFRPSCEWTPENVAMPSTHDLPTIHGWWQERDIQWKALLGHYGPGEQRTMQQQRMRDRESLWRALQNEGWAQPAAASPPAETPLSAVLAFVAHAPGPLALFSLEDVLAVIDQPNMPGAAAPGLVQHPNWVQGLPASVASLFTESGVADRLEAIRAGRSRP